MPAWFIYALVSLFFTGSQRFIYKVIAHKGLSSSKATFFFMATVTSLSFFYFLWQGTLLNLPWIILFSLFNSATFVTATIAHIKALKYYSANFTYPLIRLNILLVVLFSVIFLQESLTPFQTGGIILAILAFFTLTFSRDNKNLSHFYLILIALICGALSSISCKLAAQKVNIPAFMFFSYTLSTLSSYLFSQKKSETSKNLKQEFFWGVVMGLINFVSFNLYLLALKKGPLSIVATLNGLHFVVPIFLSILFFKEQLTKRKIWGIGLTIISIILLRI
ncbi:MAG: Prediced transporter protein [Desulfonauticus sp. 38_4375]|nr:MAG: Prediced transporter protein [Desulfonauticus sp. 38_4375]